MLTCVHWNGELYFDFEKCWDEIKNKYCTGIKDCRSSENGECNENVRLTWGSSWFNLMMPGIRPMVDTLMLLADKPKYLGSRKNRMASNTLGFANGSPIPMKDIELIFWPCCRKYRTWSVIWSQDNCCFNPNLPVAQKLHANAHPTWQEMHKERCVGNWSETASNRPNDLPVHVPFSFAVFELTCCSNKTLVAFSASDFVRTSKDKIVSLPNSSTKASRTFLGTWTQNKQH